MSRIIVTGGILYTGNEILAPADILVEGETIRSLGATDRPLDEDTVHIDASGRLVTPGLINAHTHIYSALARGISLKDTPPANFTEILEKLWWRLDRALTLDDIELSTKLHALECLRNGVTTIFDHHASQRTIRGSLTTISHALSEFGLRGCLCFEVSDREGPEAVREGIKENAAFIDGVATVGGSMRRARFGLHAAFTLSDGTLASCAEAAAPSGTGFHVHLAEDSVDGPGAASRLEHAGILGPQTICVHGVHLSDVDLESIRASGTWLVHCPQSNMNNAVGAASLERIGGAHVRTALGTDGFTANMLRESLSAHLLQNHLSGNPGAGYAHVPDLLLKGNATLAAETFGVGLGSLAPGGPADLVVWDYRPPTPLTIENLWGHLLFGLVDSKAEQVIIAGKRVLQDGKPIGCDEDALARRCTEAAKRLWEEL